MWKSHQFRLWRAALLGLLLFSGERAWSAEPVDVGTKIYPKTMNVEIRVENRVVGKLDGVTTVNKVEGDWLWVKIDEKEGWVKRSDACTVREAISYFSPQIASAAGTSVEQAYLFWARSQAYEELGDLNQAIDDANQLIRLRPKPKAYSLRGDLWRSKKEFDIAIKDYDEAIRLNPKYADAYLNRGSAWRNKGDFDKALGDYNEAIRLDPTDAYAYTGRGNVWGEKQEHDKAIADYNEAIRLNPRYALAYNNCGKTWASKGEFDKAIADYDEAIWLDPKDADAYNGVAWLRATCPEVAVRNGKQAIEFATKVCELSDWKEIACLDTLAAAYAEAGQFDKAVAMQQRALDLVAEKYKSHFLSRLDLYRAGKPYRQEPKSTIAATAAK